MDCYKRRELDVWGSNHHASEQLELTTVLLSPKDSGFRRCQVPTPDSHREALFTPEQTISPSNGLDLKACKSSWEAVGPLRSGAS